MKLPQDMAYLLKPLQFTTDDVKKWSQDGKNAKKKNGPLSDGLRYINGILALHISLWYAIECPCCASWHFFNAAKSYAYFLLSKSRALALTSIFGMYIS